MKELKLTDCKNDIREIWLENGFWPMLFCIVLLVIMILWRPSINNQRYCITPTNNHSWYCLTPTITVGLCDQQAITPSMYDQLVCIKPLISAAHFEQDGKIMLESFTNPEQGLGILAS